jgi:hypothetical protein
MQIHPPSKYHLKDLHKEIDLFDRKIAHCQHHAKFDCEEDRRAALQKLTTGRQRVVKAAAVIVSQGIEVDPNQLPRSMKLESPAQAARP